MYCLPVLPGANQLYSINRLQGSVTGGAMANRPPEDEPGNAPPPLVGLRWTTGRRNGRMSAQNSMQQIVSCLA